MEKETKISILMCIVLAFVLGFLALYKIQKLEEKVEILEKQKSIN